MDGPDIHRIRNELEGLMREQIESLTRQTFLGTSPEELLQEKERLQRIRELSADYLDALKKSSP
jgi:hypothetical protein